MVTLQNRGNRGQLGIKRQSTSILPKGGQLINERNSFFGPSADFDFIVWLKGLASDPCNAEVSSSSSFKKLKSRSLGVRKFLSLSSIEFPHRKRKLQLFLSCGKFVPGIELASKRYSDQKVAQLDTKRSFSPSSVDLTEHSGMKTMLNSYSSDSTLTSEDNNQEIQFHTDFNHTNEAPDLTISNKHISSIFDMSESIDGSFFNSKGLITEDESSMDSNEFLPSSNLSSLKKLIQLNNRFLENTYPSKPVIPIGPGFQAEIPTCMASANQRNFYIEDPKILKWLGTKIWPTESRSEEKDVFKEVRKRNRYSYSCFSQRSTKRINHHVLK